ncbi:tryptophan-rich sensory protein [Candidatus Beckwithbacteria bacterium]|nr:tryptophan-rich sensory protein [Candidatus Beckwithbacteria bacterium]
MSKKQAKVNYLKLIVSLIIPLLIGFIGSAFTTPYIKTWYADLYKPFFNPPNWIFVPVWTGLFLLMGIALYLVWNEDLSKNKTKMKDMAIQIFGLQLIANVFWSFIFFTLQVPFVAFLEILFLWFLIFWTIESFWKINKTAAYLLFPYLAWVSFASILNLSIAFLN